MYLYASTPKNINTIQTNRPGKAANYRTSTTALLIKVCLFTVCLLSLLIDLAQAQTAPIKEWDKRFGGSSYDELNKIIPTADGGYLLAGCSYSGIDGDKTAASKGSYDYWIIKINSNGVKQWDKTFGGDDYLLSMLQTSDGGYLLGRFTYEDSDTDKTRKRQRWFINIDYNGIKQWDLATDTTINSTIGQPTMDIHDEQLDLIRVADGGYLATGKYFEALGPDYSSTKIVTKVFKINTKGQIQWSKKFGGLSKESVLHTGLQTADGGFILAGYTNAGAGGDVTQSTKGGSDFWVVKTTREIKSGEIVMSNQNKGVSPGNIYYDPGFVSNYKNNQNVVQTLSARVGNKLRLTFTSFQLETTNDKLYIYDGTSTSAPLIGVYSGSSNPGIITSSGGSLTFRFISNAIFVAPGWVANISYVPVGARLAAEEPQSSSSLKLEAFPNPFTEKITLTLTTQQTGLISLKIYDSRGIEAAELFAGEIQAGETHRVEWQPNGQQEGVYIVRLATPGKVITNKIVLVR